MQAKPSESTQDVVTYQHASGDVAVDAALSDALGGPRQEQQHEHRPRRCGERHGEEADDDADAAHPSSPPPAAARYAAAWRLAHGSHRRCAEAAAVSMTAARRGSEVEGEVEEQQPAGSRLGRFWSRVAVARRRRVVGVDDGRVFLGLYKFSHGERWHASLFCIWFVSYTIVNFQLKQYFFLTPNQSAVFLHDPATISTSQPNRL